MVARQGVTDHKSMKEALDKLEFSGAKVLGFVLNDASDEGSSYYRYNGGHGRYNYYKKQYYGKSGSYDYSASSHTSRKTEKAELLKKIRKNSNTAEGQKMEVKKKK